jgi:uncharacterized protein (TIGR02231 family)
MDVESKVLEVVFLEDRVRIKRKVQLQLKAGNHKLVLAELSPYIVDKSLYVKSKHAEIINSSVSRYSSRNTRDKENLGKIYKQTKAIEEIEQKISQLSSKLAGLQEIQASFYKEIHEDVERGNEPSKGWSKSIETVNSEIAEAQKEEDELYAGVEEARKQLSDLHTLNGCVQEIKDYSKIVLNINTPSEAEYTVFVEYVAPGACWRPVHTASLKSSTLSVVTEACVWQNTGENWQDISISFSTERASLGTKAPELKPDFLHKKKKNPDVVITATEESVNKNRKVTRQTSTDVPGINDRGEACSIEIKRKVSIDSSPKPIRFRCFEGEMPAEKEMVCYPELHKAVHLKTEQFSTVKKPLLGAPVELVLNNCAVGRTEIEYTSTGEQFSLDWGPDSDIEVDRQIHEKKDKGMMSSWHNSHREVKIYLSNLSRYTKSFKLKERIPVSDSDKVKVEFDAKKTSGETSPDKDGIIVWNIEMAPGSHQCITLMYTLKHHSDVQMA